MKKLGTVLTFFVLAIATDAPAQTAGTDARPIGPVASLLKVQVTAPIIRACGPYPRGGSCFRVSFRVSTAVSGAFKLGYINTPFMHGTVAYSATGAMCQGHPIGGLAYGGTPFGNVNPQSYGWFDEPTVVTSEKSAILIVEFSCDDRLIDGDNITMEMTLAVDPGRRVQFARYSVPEMVVRARN